MSVLKSISRVARRAWRGRRRRKSGSSCKAIARRALKIAKTCAKLKTVKYIDTAWTVNLNSTSGLDSDNVHLNKLTQGDSQTSREGDYARMLSVTCKGAIYAIGAEKPNYRLIVVWDRHPQGSGPALLDIIKTSEIQSLYNVGTNRGQFQVLYDRTWTFNQGDSTNDTVKTFKFYRKINRRTSYQRGNSGTIVDIESGSLHAFMIQTSGSSAYSFNVNFRVRFLDD